MGTAKENKKDRSPQDLWREFITEFPQFATRDQPGSWYFCDNEKDANECADLAEKGIKRATSASLWWFQKHGYPLAEVGDLNIVTDWYGNAKVLIRTTKVELLPFTAITAKYAEIEGEGDKSLDYWKKVHREFYTREMQPYGEQFTEDMIIVCEYFEALKTW